MLWWWVHTQIECVPNEPARTHHFEHKMQNFENPMCTVGYFDLKIGCSSWGLQGVFFVYVYSCQC